MNFRPTGNGAPGKQLPPDNDDVSEREVGQLITFAGEYFATDFPNPARTGCPAPAALQTLARSGKLPDDQLCSHLFGCSECFRAYHAALEASRVDAPAVATPWWVEWRERLSAAFPFKPAMAIAGIFALITISSAVWLAWRETVKTEAPGVAQLRPQPTATLSAPASQGSADAVARQRGGETIAPASRPAPLVVRKVDLEGRDALRDAAAAGGAEENVIKLPQARVRLLLKLPEDGARGWYHASVVDEYDQPLAEADARSRDGKRLNVILDLRKLAAKSYRLRLSLGNGGPGHYPVRIADRQRTPWRKP